MVAKKIKNQRRTHGKPLGDRDQLTDPGKPPGDQDQLTDPGKQLGDRDQLTDPGKPPGDLDQLTDPGKPPGDLDQPSTRLHQLDSWKQWNQHGVQKRSLRRDQQAIPTFVSSIEMVQYRREKDAWKCTTTANGEPFATTSHGKTTPPPS